jgi:hypothetical protein
MSQKNVGRVTVGKLVILGFAWFWLPGCAARQDGTTVTRVTLMPDRTALAAMLTKPARPFLSLVSRSRKVPERWEWKAAIPSRLPRAELIPPVIPPQIRLKFVVPTVQADSVSPGVPEATMFVEQIGAQRIKSLADLIVAAHGVEMSEGDDPIRARITGGEGSEHAVEMNSHELSELVQGSNPEHQVVRMTLANEPSAVVRSDGVRCVIKPRVEQQLGLLQVVLTTRLVEGNRRPVPREITATCDGQPLRCLSLPETLDVLYGETDARDIKADRERLSFASVSESDDYLIPSNYQRLEKRIENMKLSFADRPKPALLDLPDVDYPGSALLGDARALAQFMLQRDLLQDEGTEKVGWVLFGGAALRRGRAVQLTVDLGEGPKRIDFVFPH